MSDNTQQAGMLIVDDVRANISVFVQILRTDYKISEVLAQPKGLGLFGDVDASLPNCFTGDQTRLRQVLMNLVGNAIKFTEKGRVCVTVTQESAQMLRFAVTDTGIGIPPEQQGRDSLGSSDKSRVGKHNDPSF